MFTQLKKLLPKEINKLGLKGEIDAMSVISSYKKNCSKLLGDDALENLVPRYFKNNKLYIDATNSAWAQHLHVRQSELIDEIKKSANEVIISGFVIQIKNNA